MAWECWVHRTIFENICWYLRRMWNMSRSMEELMQLVQLEPMEPMEPIAKLVLMLVNNDSQWLAWQLVVNNHGQCVTHPRWQRQCKQEPRWISTTHKSHYCMHTTKSTKMYSLLNGEKCMSDNFGSIVIFLTILIRCFFKFHRLPLQMV